MIFVTVGTQDKSFRRLLKAIDREIENGNIKEKVVVQAGYTKYKSKNMEIFDLVSPSKFNELLDEANLVITHGGAGNILTAIKKGKKVIGVPRLKRYKEHTNDHQVDLINEFSNKGYILAITDLKELDKVLKEAKDFKPKQFRSNTNKMIKLIDNYIEEDNHTSWYNKYGFVLRALFFYIIYIFMFRIIILLDSKNINSLEELLMFSNVILGVLVVISYFPSKYLVYNYKDKSRVDKSIKLILYLALNSILIDICLATINSNLVYVVFFIISCLMCKYIIFRNK